MTDFSEIRRAHLEVRAKKDFKKWQEEHPLEAKILGYLDTEFRHRHAADDNPRRAQLMRQAQESRRKLEFDDTMTEYVQSPPEIMYERMAEDRFCLPADHWNLLKTVNNGYWTRAGHFVETLPLTPEELRIKRY